MDFQSRREFLKKTTLTATFLGLQSYVNIGCSTKAAPNSKSIGLGPTVKDPNGILDLPEGFSYKIISVAGDKMDDGYFVPVAHDGMATFEGPNGTTIIVRNHEVSPGNPQHGPHAGDPALWKKLTASKMYDPGRGNPLCMGGTTTLVYDTKKQELLRHYLSLAGTVRNCSGGPTPWGSWVTCEETVQGANSFFEHDHGYNFEVPATDKPGLADAIALKEMGRFNHEAIAVDPASGIVYQTEDRPDGLIYRFIPNLKGELSKGGKLQALAVKDSPSVDTRNWPENDPKSFPINKRLEVEWLDLADTQPEFDDLRIRGFKQGAAKFARGEGMVYGNGEVYFACTNGGLEKAGQIFKYKPSEYEGTSREKDSPGLLELFVESHDSKLLKSCDNLTISPWGDAVICEDDGGNSSIVGITPKGEIYHIGETRVESELAGCCFSPDGSTLFVNIQWNPGQTLAITGPWNRS